MCKTLAKTGIKIPFSKKKSFTKHDKGTQLLARKLRASLIESLSTWPIVRA
jgi:hypothetical protein